MLSVEHLIVLICSTMRGTYSTARRGRGTSFRRVLMSVGHPLPVRAIATDEELEARANACMPLCVVAAAAIRGLAKPFDLDELDRSFGAALEILKGMEWYSTEDGALGFGVLVQSGLLEAIVDAALHAARQGRGFRPVDNNPIGPNMERVLWCVLEKDTYRRYGSLYHVDGSGYRMDSDVHEQWRQFVKGGCSTVAYSDHSVKEECVFAVEMLISEFERTHSLWGLRRKVWKSLGAQYASDDEAGFPEYDTSYEEEDPDKSSDESDGEGSDGEDFACGGSDDSE